MQATSIEERPKFLILDFLRFCTAVLVVIFHYELFILRDATTAKRYFGAFDVGVDLFFVLSGFVIAHNYAGRLQNLGDYFYFLQKRIARIYPLHLLMTLAVIAMVVGAHVLGQPIKEGARYGIHYLPGQLTMTHAWGIHDRLSFNHVSWSISAEWFAYLMFPLLMGACLRLGAKATLLGLVLLVCLMEAAAQIWGLTPWNQRTYDFGILRALPSFTAGIAIWLVWKAIHRTTRISPAVVVIIAAIALASMFLQPFRSVTIAIFVVLILAGALADHAVPGRLARPMQVLGNASYGLYLSHTIVGTVIFTVLWNRVAILAKMPLLTACLAFAISLIGSIVLYRIFEDPLRRRLGRNRWLKV